MKDNRAVAKDLRNKGDAFRIALVKYVWDEKTTADDLRHLWHEIMMIDTFIEKSANEKVISAILTNTGGK